MPRRSGANLGLMTMSKVHESARSRNNDADRPHTKLQLVRVDLAGDDCCRCQEIDAAVTANAPVLAMCRQLLATGVDPDTPLCVYRRGVLALKVRSLREGARLTVKTAGNGTPIFTLDDVYKGAAAPPVSSKPDFDPWQGERL